MFKFKRFITATTYLKANKLAQKEGFTLEETGPLAMFFIAGASEISGKSAQLIDKAINLDVASEDYKLFMKELNENEDFVELVKAITKVAQQDDKIKKKTRTKVK